VTSEVFSKNGVERNFMNYAFLEVSNHEVVFVVGTDVVDVRPVMQQGHNRSIQTPTHTTSHENSAYTTKKKDNTKFT
jgi:hypothetical protein